MKTRFLFAILFLTVFSIVISENAYGSLSLDKGSYSWTDKVKIRLMVHGFDHKQDTIQISVGDNELKSYKLSKAGNGLYTGEVILTGFSHDVDGDGKPDTNPRTTGSGPNNGFLESIRDENLEVLIRFQDGTKLKTTTKITWNIGEISFDMSNHQIDQTAKLHAIDPDMNLNPKTLDKLPIHVFSDSDKAGILVDAIETDEESGIFETTISFTQNSVSSGNRLFVISGDAIYAQYTDHTLPKPYDIHDDLEIFVKSMVHESLIVKPEQDKSIPKNCRPGTTLQDGICVQVCDVNDSQTIRKVLNDDPVVQEFLKLHPSAVFEHSPTYDEPGNPWVHSSFRQNGLSLGVITSMYDKNGDCFWIRNYSSNYEFPPSGVGIGMERSQTFESDQIPQAILAVNALTNPIKQMKMGIPVTEIKCKEGLVPIVKIDRIHPACVTDSTWSELLKRGWTPLRLGMPAATNILITYDTSNIFPMRQAQSFNSDFWHDNMIYWVNNDIVSHTIAAKDYSWQVGPIEPGRVDGIMFNQTGIFSYFVEENPNTTGRVVFE